jgi:RimJ/RimL family protein N-acetyltransferase
MSQQESTRGQKDVLDSRIWLRDMQKDDLELFFEQQLDAEANYMAAFTTKDPADRAVFTEHWAKILADASIQIKTILFAGQVAGYVLMHGWFGDPEVSYWLGRGFWGKGIATRALAEFLTLVQVRPLYARVAKDNLRSLRVLEKCGFKVSGSDRGFANARGEEIEEIILELKLS